MIEKKGGKQNQWLVSNIKTPNFETVRNWMELIKYDNKIGCE